MGNNPGVFKSEEEKETDYRGCPLIFADSQYTGLRVRTRDFRGSHRGTRTRNEPTLAFGFPFLAKGQPLSVLLPNDFVPIYDPAEHLPHNLVRFLLIN